MEILALDLSTKSTGLAVINENKEVLYYDCITSASTDLIKRIHIMTDEIKKVLEKYPEIKKVIMEEVMPKGGYGVGNQKTHKALMWLQASIAFMLHDNFSNTEIEYTYPSSWRATCGIKNGRGITRTTLKEADIAYVKEHYNIDVNDDIADAICIGVSAVSEKVDEELNWGE